MKILKEIIGNNSSDYAFLIGNGINRHNNADKSITWDNILIEFWNQISENKISKNTKEEETKVPIGISLPEFYEIIKLRNELNNSKELSTEKKFLTELENKLNSWQVREHHKNIVNLAKENNIPILTTNFDHLLEKTNELKQFKLGKQVFIDRYPCLPIMQRMS